MVMNDGDENLITSSHHQFSSLFPITSTHHL